MRPCTMTTRLRPTREVASDGLGCEHVMPRMTDRFLATHQVHRLRAHVCADLHGDIVEVRFGSGLTPGTTRRLPDPSQR